MSEHTPGPWDSNTVYERGFMPLDFRERTRTVMATTGDVAYLCNTRSAEDTEANARLIAAAPDLLAAGQRFLDAGCDGEWWHAKAAMKLAVAKATGAPSNPLAET